VLTFWTVFVLFTVADLVTDDLDYAFVALIVATYALARHRPRRYMWPAAVALAVMIAVSAPSEDEVLPAIIAPAALFSATILLGAYRQTRRAYLDSLIERADRLERERDQQAKLAVVAERSRIAREMHDIIAHNLAVMVALAEGAAYSAERAPKDARAAMAKVSETGRQALGEMRRLLSVLRDTDTADSEGNTHKPSPQPGVCDLPDLVDQVKAAGQRATLRVIGDPFPLTAGAELAAYRIVQEALTNTLKHAGKAASVEVQITFTSSALMIDVTDDGAGQLATRRAFQAPGQGLLGMRERAASYEGSVEAGPNAGKGWHVRVHLPIAHASGSDEFSADAAKTLAE
jgi:signal transduction histidine kinase